jgi:uncharacterized RDD family membrane protein YckC/cytoskeletal protein CcmA (bactofilin family)
MDSRFSVMQARSRLLFFGALVACCCCALTLAGLAQPPAPTPATAPEKPTTPAAAEPPATPAPTTAPVEQPAAAPVNTPPAATPAPEGEKKTDDSAEPTRRLRRLHGRHGGDNDRVSVMGETRVDAGEMVEGAAVAVLGDVTVDGEVTGDSVAVLGDNHINGTVGGNAVVVLGDLYLGPKAKVHGDILCVTGDVHRDPGAEVDGKILKKAVGSNKHLSPKFERWWTESVKPARVLGFTPGFSWTWIATLFAVALYVVLALVFPGGVRRTGDMLVRRPVATVMSGMLSIIALPVLFVLLLITIVGIPVAIVFLPLGVVLGILFGKAALYGLVGRAVTADKFHPALAVLVGTLLFVMLYLVPMAGALLWMLVAFLGFGCVVTALATSDKKPAVAAAAPAASVMSAPIPMVAPEVTAPPMAFAGAGAATVPPASPPLVGASAPVVTRPPVATLSAATAPRAGFWIRVAAVFIDAVIIGACFGPWVGPGVVPILALYGALMWKFRGTTVGGIVCGLQLVRLDDRPVDWATAIVRALACFLSLVVVGLGFVWVVFDDEKQSWHDKIAGTVIVRPPKRVSLV